MKLLLRVSCCDEYLDPQPAFCIVDINPQYAKWLLRAIDMCKYAVDNFSTSVYALEVFDEPLAWVSYDDGCAWDWFSMLPERDSPVLLAPSVAPEDLGEDAMMEAETVLAKADRVCWSGRVKHTDIPAYTYDVPQQLLELIAREV